MEWRDIKGCFLEQRGFFNVFARIFGCYIKGEIVIRGNDSRKEI